MTKRRPFFALCVAIVAYCFILAATLVQHPERYQLDFQLFYRGSLADARGENPYSLLLTNGDTELMYCYPPHLLPIFRPFLSLNYETAAAVYLLLKCAALGLLVLLWIRCFFRDNIDATFPLLCLFGFNSTIFHDFQAGNTSVFEQLLVWTGFACLVRGRHRAFAVCIIAAATQKLVPIALLAVLLLDRSVALRDRLVRFSVPLLGFLGLQAASWLYWPDYYRSFLYIIGYAPAQEGGILNPSTFTFFRGLLQLLPPFNSPGSPEPAAWLLYGLAVLGVLLVSVRTLPHLRGSNPQEERHLLVMLSCFVYALVLPRFKDYSYIILLPPAYHVIRKVTLDTRFFFLLFLLIPSPADIPLPYLAHVFKLGWEYYPFLVTATLWALFLVTARGAAHEEPRT